MLDLTLTNYANSLSNNQLNFDGFVLIGEGSNITDITSLDLLSNIPLSSILFEDEASSGSVYYFEEDEQFGTSCRIHIQDNSFTTYTALGILFYTVVDSVKHILGGFLYSDRESTMTGMLLIKKEGEPISLWLSFNPIPKIIKFQATIASPKTAHAGSIDGQIHIEDENIKYDDNYSVYSKLQVDSLLQNYITADSLAGDFVTIDTEQTITSDKTINEKSLLISDNQDSPVTESLDQFVLRRGQEFIVGTQTEQTNIWTGTTKQNSLYDGMCINYFLPNYGTTQQAKLNLTLPNGTSVEYPIYAMMSSGSFTRVSNQYYAFSTLRMTLLHNKILPFVSKVNPASVWLIDSYYADMTDQLTSENNYFKAGTNGLFRGTLILRTGNNTWESVVTSPDTATTKLPNTSGFYLDAVYYYIGNDITAGNTSTGNSAYIVNPSFSLLNSLNTTSSDLSATSPIYFVFTYNRSDGKFYLDPTKWWTQDPVSDSNTAGKYYLYIGKTSSTNSAFACLSAHHPLFCVRDGNLIQTTIDNEDITKQYEVFPNDGTSTTIVNDYRKTAPDGNEDNNPRWSGNTPSLYIKEYIPLVNNSRISLYISFQSYTGSIAIFDKSSTTASKRYNVYPIYFRGDNSSHNPTIPQGTILQLTFRNNAFYSNFYDLADFGVEHEPIVRIGNTPHVNQDATYVGTLVAYQESGKLDKFINVSYSVSNKAITVEESFSNIRSNSPIYVSFQGRCYSSHPRVPFGFITQVEYIYSSGTTPLASNLKFYYVKNGAIVDDNAILESFIVTNPNSALRYFHIDNAPVYLLPSRNNTSEGRIISIGEPSPANENDAILLGYLLSGVENAGLIRLVDCHFNDTSHYSEYSSKANSLLYVNTNSDQYRAVDYNTCATNSTIIANTTANAITPDKTNSYNLGSTAYNWNYLYANYLGSSLDKIAKAYIQNLRVTDSLAVEGVPIFNLILQSLYAETGGLYILRITAKVTNSNYYQVINRGDELKFNSSYYTVSSIYQLRFSSGSSNLSVSNATEGYQDAIKVNAPSVISSGRFILLNQVWIHSTSSATHLAWAVKSPLYITLN